MAERKPTPDILAAAAPVDVLGDVLSGKPAAPKPSMIATAYIRTSGGTQMRAGLDQDTVTEYYEKFAEAGGWGPFPPVVVFFDGADYWLADGFHRVEGYRRAVAYQKIPNGDGFTPIPCDVRTGTRRDAILFAASANSNHGLRRTNADKRRSVDVLLRDSEWAQWSDTEIARKCAVSQPFVTGMRKELSHNGYEIPTERTVIRNGQTYTQNTTNIGTTPKQPHHVTPTPAPQPGKAAYWAPEPSDREYDNESVVISDTGGSRQKNAELAKCTVCHRPLSDPASAVAGVGPCCAAKRAAAAAGGGDTTIDGEESQDVTPTSEPLPTPDQSAIPVSQRDDYDSDEWYTPKEYIEAARAVMGGIDLDPASCDLAQEVVQADVYLTKEDNGLACQWIRERVWINPPYGQADPWVNKLLAEFDGGKFVKQAIILLNNMTETAYFQALLARFPVCIPSRRIAFWRHDQSGTTGRQGQALFYLGPNVDQFVEEFRAFGPILRRID